MSVPDSFLRPAVSGIEKIPVPRCPVCRCEEKRPLFVVKEHEYETTTDDPFSFVACLDCGAWYLDPRPAPSALGIIYPPNYYAYVADEKVRERLRSGKAGTTQDSLGRWLFKKRLAPIARHIALGPGVEWLDVGCGAGIALHSMRQAYDMVGTGLDLSESAVSICRERGFRARSGRFEDYVPEAGESYDLIHSSHLIEHVESPLDYMKKAFQLLKPGGLNVYVTPNISTWEARRFGSHWGGLHVPRHWALLNAESARRLSEIAGFEHVGTRFSTNGTFWTWSFHSALQGVLGRRWNDSLFPSDHRFVEPKLWNIFRIGLFTVFDAAGLILTRQSSNMLVISRKPPTAPP